MDMIEKQSRMRAKQYYMNTPQVKNVKLLDSESGELITCECGNYYFKLYKKFGGLTVSSYRHRIKEAPVVYNYVCKCGKRLILKEDSFKFAKIKYGCAAQKCPYGNVKMDKNCLKCKYIYEK